MYKEFDIENWKRKDSYLFFKTYDDPFFNICSHLDINTLYNFCKDKGHSFNLAMLFYSIQTANEIEEFKLRTLDGKLVLYNHIHCGITILNNDETFSFCYLEYAGSLAEFETEGKRMIQAQKSQKILDPNANFINLIYFSLIPWISFSSIKHARKSDTNASIPKIAIGKYFKDNGIWKIPVSVEVNHSLMDGIHVGKYFNLLQDKINTLA